MLSNSMKFTIRGFVKISVWYIREDETLHFEISDSGVGVKEEDRNKLFTLFGKLDSS